MHLIKKIVFPVDLEETVDDYIPYATALAEKFTAILYLVTVIPEIVSVAAFHAPDADPQALHDEFLQGVEAKIQAVAERLQNLARLEIRILQGGAAAQIIDFARQEGVDLIIMGTHGRAGLEKAMLGSVCDKVIKSGVCPVLAIPG